VCELTARTKPLPPPPRLPPLLPLERGSVGAPIWTSIIQEESLFLSFLSRKNMRLQGVNREQSFIAGLLQLPILPVTRLNHEKDRFNCVTGIVANSQLRYSY